MPEKMVDLGFAFVCELDQGGAPPSEVQVCYPGRWDGHWSGRPLVITEADQEAMVQNQLVDAQPVPFDYDHQSIYHQKNGARAVASGWGAMLANRGPQGLWVMGVEWTDEGAARIRAKEYRYLSGVFFQNHPDPRSGRGRGMWLHSIALTNIPFIRGLPGLAASAGFTGGRTMDKGILCAILGLSPDSSDETIKAELARRQEVYSVCGAPEVRALLPWQHPSELRQGITRVIETYRQREAADLIAAAVADGRVADTQAAAYLASAGVFQGTFKGFLESLPKGVHRSDAPAQALVASALGEGKVTKAQEPAALLLAKADPEAFKTFVASASAQVPLDKTKRPPAQEGGAPPRELTDEEALVCSQMGLDAATFAAQLDVQA